MKTSKAVALALAALVLGLVVGNVAVGFAATTSDTATTTGGVAGACLRLGGAMRDAGGRLVDVVAKLTDQTPEAVTEQREAGKTFAQIADANDVEAATVVAEALKVREQVLADRVADGSITQDQADLALERMESRLTDRVNSADACNGAGAGAGGGACGGGGGGMMGGRGRGGAGGCNQGTVSPQ